MAGVIVQYIVLRSDLIDKLSWPLGAVITQACHASSAIIHLTRDDQICQQYVADLDNMHKVVLKVFYFSLKQTLYIFFIKSADTN